MAKVRLKLRSYRSASKEGYPIFYLVNYAGQRYWRKTEYFATAKQWSTKSGNVTASHPKGKKLQNYLSQQVLEKQIHLTKCEQEGLSFQEAWSVEAALPTFTQFYEQRLQQLIQAKDLGNHKVYKYHYQWLQKHAGTLTFKALTRFKVKELLALCDGQGLSYSTIRQRFATYKAVYNEAARNFGAKIPVNPFNQLLSGRKAVTVQQKKHQPLKALQKIAQFEHDDFKFKSEGQQRAVDMWLLAFMLRGAGVADVLYFNPDNLVEGYYRLQRLKMPKRQVWLQVKIEPEMQRLIDRYQRPYNRYLFKDVQVPRNDTTLHAATGRFEGNRQYLQAHRNTDAKLKRAAKRLGIAPLSMKQARHSWVILARDQGVPKEIIEQAIGHQGQSVMDQHYFGRYEQSQLDTVNRQIIDLMYARS
mgnify:CR=1 FL=1